MPTARKPRSAHLTREDVEAMIAEGFAAERTRNDQAIAGLLLAVGGASQAISELAEAVAKDIAHAGRTLDLHAGIIGPMADAFAASMGVAASTVAPDATPH